MKRISIADYNPTETEIRYLFGDDESDGRNRYESFLKECEEFYEDDDSARRMVALLLQHRGDREGADKIAKGIEDVGFRQEVLHWLGKLEVEAANPGLIVD